jgi:hypothetical protein
MAHIHELMGAGVPARLAQMLGSNRLQTVQAAGSSAEDATQLAINFALIATSGPGQGVALDYATGAAVTALYNTGPDTVLIYPAADDAFNDQAPDLPLALSPAATFLAVPAVDCWLVVIGGSLADAPADGNLYARQNGMWVPVPPVTPQGVWVTTGGIVPVGAGIGRVYVKAGAPVTLILPPNDVVVMDRGPQAGTFTITCQPPAGATINGNPGYAIIDDWDAAQFFYDGANYGMG